MDHFAYFIESRHYLGGECTFILLVTMCDNKIIQIKVIKDQMCMGKTPGEAAHKVPGCPLPVESCEQC